MIPNSLFEQTDLESMMALLESDKIKLLILKLLYENGEMTYGRLRTKIHTGYKTIKNNCEFLEKISFITTDEKVIGEGGKMTFVTLTQAGKNFQQGRAVSDEQTPYG